MAQAAASSSDTLLSASLASASSLVFLQLFSRLFTFALNQALVRLASPQTFGTAAIQFELLLSTILFFSREGVRNALLRAHSPLPSSEEQPAESSSKVGTDDLITNISLLPVFMGIPTSIVAALLYIASSSPVTTSQPHFHISVTVYAIASFLELLSEPLYIRAQNQLRFGVRVQAEGGAVITKTLVTFAILVTAPPEWALLAFAGGQAAYGFTMLVSYLRAYGQDSPIFFKKVTTLSHDNTTSKYFDRELLHLSYAMTWQSMVKHILTEGDKFLISHLSPLADQGGYALASNYGSLVARIILQPIEESSRVFFSKTLSTSSNINKEAISTASHILQSLLLLFTHLFLALAAFGPPYLSLAVSILLPPRYQRTSAPIILGAYIYYIPTMAFNGLLEAFVASTSTSSDLQAQSRWMLFFSLAFIATAVVLARELKLGDVGLVWANIANLGFRALYAWIFVLRFFHRQSAGNLVNWRNAVPPPAVLVIFAMSAGVTRWSAKVYHDLPIWSQLGHVAVGVTCVIGCLTACFIFERATFQAIFTIIRRNK